MFGSATNTLALIGVCAIVFWIICWLILMSKSDAFPRFVQNAAAALAAVLAFCSAIPSALLALPIWINFQKTYDEISKREYNRGLGERRSVSASQLDDMYYNGYDRGYETAEKRVQAKYEKLIREQDLELIRLRKALDAEETKNV